MTKRKGPMVANRQDYDNATGIGIVFDDVKLSLAIPDDITKIELIGLLTEAAVRLATNASGLIMSDRHKKEIQEFIQKSQQEDKS